MVKQLDLLAAGKVIPTALHAEMERSYLEYAMSVIIGRALPDVRDGLKPVHRRILYAMHELGLTPDRPYRKCARVVGDVLGKYHPHGDQAVYDALVRMVQDFSSRYPLLDGHGNFGSVDNDPPAAMRYTETRLAPVGNATLLGEIGEATVDYVDNFDSSQQEPSVLPAQLPILLLNGCSGIAVGMATNVPPHNLGEIVDGLIALIDRPDLGEEKLLELIPGPDFPTGGEIVGRDGIVEAYQTGRGSIPLRGVATIEEIEQGRRRKPRYMILVSELPYQVNKAGWIEKVAALVNQGRLDGIADIRDESSREGMRVVIELKRDANPPEVLRQLYRQTALQSNFGTILLTLVNNKPCQLSLRQLLLEFLQFRETTLTRRYRHELEKAQTRYHLVSGLLIALEQIEVVIQILRNVPDGATAKLNLQERLNISETQADAILAMPLRRLIGLEQQKLTTEASELQTQIARLEALLGDRHELLKSLKKDLRSLKRKFGDARRTRIIEPEKLTGSGRKSAAATVALPLVSVPEDALLRITHKGMIYWQSPPKPDKSPRKLDSLLVLREPLAGRSQVIVITASGKGHPINVGEIPSSGSRPTALIQLLSSTVQQKREDLFGAMLPPVDLDSQDLVLLTRQGRIKRLAGSEFQDLTNRGAQLIRLKDDDQLLMTQWATPQQDLLVATSSGRVLKCTIDDEQVPVMGRTAQGAQITRVRKGEQVISGCVATPKTEFVLITQQGYAKRLDAQTLDRKKRGDVGAQMLQFGRPAKGSRDRVVGMGAIAPKMTKIPLLTSSERLAWLPLATLSLWGREGRGDRAVALEVGEAIVEVLPSSVY
ncbi:MAG: DNA topoisomerase (ATP-hydrolyzing) [Cyanobacteria bacterium P01_G01_bin.54]